MNKFIRERSLFVLLLIVIYSYCASSYNNPDLVLITKIKYSKKTGKEPVDNSKLTCGNIPVEFERCIFDSLNIHKEEFNKKVNEMHLYMRQKEYHKTISLGKELLQNYDYWITIDFSKNLYYEIGFSYLCLNSPQQAIDYLSKGIKNLTRIDSVAALLFMRRGGALSLIHEYNSAIKDYNGALDFYMGNETLNSRSIARLYNHLGLSYSQLGSHNLSLEFYNKAALLQKKYFGKKDLFYAYYLSNVGIKLNTLNRYDEAEVKLTESLRIIESIFGQNNIESASLYNNLGLVHLNMNLYMKAIQELKQCIKIVSSQFPNGHRLISKPHTTLGIIYHKKGQLVKALEHHKIALRIREKMYGEKHPNIARSYNYIAQNYFDMREYSTSIDNYHKALIANLQGFNTQDIKITPSSLEPFSYQFFLESLTGKSRAFKYLSKNSGNENDLLYALDNLKLADKLITSNRLTQLSFSDKIEINRIAKSAYADAIEVSLEISKTRNNYKDSAFYYSETSRAGTLTESLVTQYAKRFASISPETLDLERRIKTQQSYYRSRLNSVGVETVDHDTIQSFWEDQLFKANRSLDTLAQFFEKSYPKYYDLKYSKNVPDLDKIQQFLNPNDALLEYFVNDSSFYLFVVTKETYNVLPLKYSGSLKNDVQSFRSALKASILGEKHHIDELNVRSYLLYQKYLEPAIDKLNDSINKLIIVPDAELSYVPFDILLTNSSLENKIPNESKPYLLRKYQTQYAYSGNLLYNNPSRTSSSSQNDFVAFAPQYDELSNPDSKSSFLLGQFRGKATKLKYNQPEVKLINKYMNGQVLLGSLASERQFKNAAQNYRILHLAMHAFVDDVNPMNSQLVFTPNQDSLEDNFLHAHELYNMEIPADMVVLSACETGFGKLQKGEGVMSLARAFAYAGCPSVVMSHWAVNDATTAKLMELFYKYLADGLEKDKALQQAKLEFLKNADPAQANPYFWGSFVVMGDVSPINIQKPISWQFLVILGVILLFVILFLLKKLNFGNSSNA